MESERTAAGAQGFSSVCDPVHLTIIKVIEFAVILRAFRTIEQVIECHSGSKKKKKRKLAICHGGPTPLLISFDLADPNEEL